MIRRILYILFLILLAYGIWYFWQNRPTLAVFEEFRTFKIRFAADKIISEQKSRLLTTTDATLLEPQVLYFPYLLMEVKYAKEGKGITSEGWLLWGLADGEMVLDTTKWDKTHGFEDCITAHVKENDLKLLRTLAKGGGRLEKEKLAQSFKGREAELDKWIEGAEKKKLIVSEGTFLRLHFENPKLEIEPHTALNEWVVTLPHTPKNRQKKRYNTSEIQKFASLAFGSDFAIRRVQEVFLPVYEIAVQNSDGSVLKTYWNALTGKQVDEFLRPLAS